MIPCPISLKDVPSFPGVYLYKDDHSRVIYAGKALNLKKRVASYFNKSHQDVKTQTLVENIKVVQTIVVESELEALILEANLIKKFKPQFNIRLMDDKDYLYIKITKEDFPRVGTARKSDLKGSLDFFGPFPSSMIVRETLKKLRRIFKWCTNPPNKGRRQKKACFYFHLKLCSGVCVGVVDKIEYRKQIFRFIRLMQGRADALVDELKKEMRGYAKGQRFEAAAAMKKMIEGISYLRASTNISFYLDNPNFVADQNLGSVEELKKALNLQKLPSRIECYDVSNLVGKQAVGSMVVLTNGEIDKSSYRKFKIKIEGKPNDYAMHQEIMLRRLKHTEWGMPDLILIDGGRGQVRASGTILRNKGLNIPVFGIAKRFEWLYPMEGDVIKLPRRSLAIRLMQKIRDESHRFAIEYHRKVRSKAFLGHEALTL